MPKNYNYVNFSTPKHFHTVEIKNGEIEVGEADIRRETEGAHAPSGRCLRAITDYYLYPQPNFEYELCLDSEPVQPTTERPVWIKRPSLVKITLSFPEEASYSGSLILEVLEIAFRSKVGT